MLIRYRASIAICTSFLGEPTALSVIVVATDAIGELQIASPAGGSRLMVERGRRMQYIVKGGVGMGWEKVIG